MTDQLVERRAQLLADVARGLSLPQKQLDPKYFYDERGSALFEQITALPEYYLTRAERKLLESEIGSVIEMLRPRTLVELGAGSATKTRIILEAMMARESQVQYVPVDVSGEFLETTARGLRERYPELEVKTAIADFSRALELPEIERPALFAFLGSTIGNFEEDEAVAILRTIARQMQPGDRFLLGADLRKEISTIEAAYNDSAGVTAEFNLNVLRVLNHDLGANFDLDAFRHRAVYDAAHHRIEMHLDSLRSQTVRVPGIDDIQFLEGESIRTELSCKYDKAAIARVFSRAGLCLDDWLTGDEKLFALAIGGAAPRVTPLHRSDLRRRVTSLFTPAQLAGAAPKIGAELELIPFEDQTHRPVPIRSSAGPGSLDVLQRLSSRMRWKKVPADNDPPSWVLPSGSKISFEPGGQIEISSPPCVTANALLRELTCTAQLLVSVFASEGISLEAVGVDPYNDIREVQLQLHRPRYERMTRYFNSIGPSGERMMRQTASLQINVDAGSKPGERWQLLNSLAPYVVAMFANSPAYASADTGHKSFRSYLWRTLDHSRTGMRVDSIDSVAGYFDFALEAGAMMHLNGGYGSFSEWMQSGEPSMDDWDLHLSTLFPEVRPRGYFELRSADAIDPAELSAPITFVSGIVYDDNSAHAAANILQQSGSVSLEVAGRDGLNHPAIRETAIELADVALSGAKALGEEFISSTHLESAARFFDRYTRRGLAPADERG